MSNQQNALPGRLRAIAVTIDKNSHTHPLRAYVDVLEAARIIDECKTCNAATHAVIDELNGRIEKLEKQLRQKMESI